MEKNYSSISKSTECCDHETHRRNRLEVKRIIIRNFFVLMRVSDNRGWQWRSTLTDLAELTHMAWTTGQFTDERNRPLTFTAMFDHVCRVLGCRRVKYPSSLVERARRRKGIRAVSVIERYTDQYELCHVRNPMKLDIKCVRK